MAGPNEIVVTFSPAGDEDVLGAIKKVTRHVSDLKRIASTPIDLDIVKGSMDPASFQRLVDTVNQAKEATKGLGKETAKAGQEAAKAAKEAQKFAESMANMGKGKTIDNSGLTAAAFSKGAGGISPNVQSSLSSLKKVNEEIGRIRQLASTPIELKIFKTSLPTADYEKLKESVLRARKEVEQMNKEIGSGKVKAQGLGESLGFVGRIIAAMAIRRLAHEVFSMADAFTNLQNKLKATVKEDSIGFISKEIFNIAQESRTSIESITTAFSRTTRSVKALGKSQTEVLQFTSTLAKAIQLGGSSAVESSNAMIQLSQGMGSGALRGDELRSVLEQLPIVAELIADKMGVPISALRELGAAGKITTDVIFDAINDRTEEIDAKMKTMALTVKQAWTQLINQATMSSEKLGGVMSMFAKVIQLVTNNFEAFALVVGSIVAGVVLGTLASQIVSIVTALKAMTVALAAGTGGLSLIIPAIAATAGILIPLVSQINIVSDSTVTFGDLWVATWQEIKSSFQDNSVADGIKTVEVAMEGIDQTTRKAILGLASMIDLLTSFGPTALVKAGVAWATDTKYFSMVEDKVKKILDRTDENSAADATDRELNVAKQILAEDMAGDTGPNTVISKKEKAGRKEAGKTWDSIMKEAMFSEEASKLDDLEEKIQTRLHKALESLKPSLKKTAKDFNAEISKLGNDLLAVKLDVDNKFILNPEAQIKEQDAIKKKIAGLKAQFGLYDEQRKKLEQIIRTELTREDEEKKRLQRLKEERKALEEYSTKYKKFAEDQKKLVKDFYEDRVERKISQDKEMESVAGTLDPMQALYKRMEQLQEFKKFAQDHGMSDWAKMAADQIDQVTFAIVTGGDHIKTFQDQLDGIFGPGGTLIKGFADATANAIVMSSSLKDLKSAIKDVLNSVEKQALSALIQLPLNMGIGALEKALKGPTASKAFTAGGSNGVRSVSAAEAASWGMSSGGYTGNAPTDAVAGFVHGQEYVLNADATRKIGRQNLDMMNKGMVPVAPTASAPAPTNITVNNNAPGVDVQTREISPGQIEIMIAKGIRDQAPRVVAGQINDPNSMISRGLQKNLESSRRRV